MTVIQQYRGNDGAEYCVTSHYNGLAYGFARDELSVFVQGDDADAFRADWEACDGMERFPRDCTGLEYLWDEMGYGMNAERA